MEFFVEAPESNQTRKKRGGSQKSIPLKLTVLSLAGEKESETELSSAHEAAKFTEMYNSRSNIASKLKRDGHYIYVKNDKILLFTAVVATE